MEKPIACIEIASNGIRLLVSQEIDNQPVVIYTKEVVVPGLLNQGVVVSQENLVKSLSELTSIRDEIARLQLNIKEACLVLPSIGLKVYTCKKVTNVIGDSVAKIDIGNVISMVNKEKTANGEEAVDIIPDEFILDDGRRFVNPPLGERSTRLTIVSKMQTLPNKIVREYKSSLNQANIRLKNVGVAAYCYAELFKSYKDLEKNYILLDIGAKISTLTLVGNGSPFASLFFFNGSEALTKKIAEAFNITFEEAEALKKDNGFDTKEHSYNAPLFDNGGVKIYQKELNNVIYAFMNDYARYLTSALAKLTEGYNGALDNFPIYLTGGGSMLANIETLLKPNVGAHSVTFVLPRSLGARDAKYACLLGCCLASSHYKGTLENNHHGVAEMGRVEEGKAEQPKKKGLRAFFSKQEEEDVL